jgi:hypothetical protein
MSLYVLETCQSSCLHKDRTLLPRSGQGNHSDMAAPTRSCHQRISRLSHVSRRRYCRRDCSRVVSEGDPLCLIDKVDRSIVQRPQVSPGCANLSRLRHHHRTLLFTRSPLPFRTSFALRDSSSVPIRECCTVKCGYILGASACKRGAAAVNTQIVVLLALPQKLLRRFHACGKHAHGILTTRCYRVLGR